VFCENWAVAASPFVTWPRCGNVIITIRSLTLVSIWAGYHYLMFQKYHVAYAVFFALTIDHSGEGVDQDQEFCMIDVIK